MCCIILWLHICYVFFFFLALLVVDIAKTCEISIYRLQLAKYLCLFSWEWTQRENSKTKIGKTIVKRFHRNDTNESSEINYGLRVSVIVHFSRSCEITTYSTWCNWNLHHIGYLRIYHLLFTISNKFRLSIKHI